MQLKTLEVAKQVRIKWMQHNSTCLSPYVFVVIIIGRFTDILSILKFKILT